MVFLINVFLKHQPLSAPIDVKRYFVSPTEAGELCLMSSLFGKNRDIFYPKLDPQKHLQTFSEIALSYVEEKGFTPVECSSEDEARKSKIIDPTKKMACFLFKSDTTGEKPFEEFYTEKEIIDISRFTGIGVIKNPLSTDDKELDEFTAKLATLREVGKWNKSDIVALYKKLLPDLNYEDNGNYLDGKM